MCTGCNSFVYIAFHQSQVFQSLCQYFTYFLMYRHVSDARSGNFQCFVVAGQYYIIYIFLTSLEFSTDRNGTGMVGTIIAQSFCTCVGQHHASYFQNVAVVVVMQCFTMLSQDSGKRSHASIRRSDAVQYSGNILFFYSRFA